MNNYKDTIKKSFIAGLVFTITAFGVVYAANITSVQSQTIRSGDIMGTGWFQDVNDNLISFTCNSGTVGTKRWDGYECKYLNTYSLKDNLAGTLYCKNSWYKRGSGYATNYTCSSIVHNTLYTRISTHVCNPDKFGNDGDECMNINLRSNRYVWSK